MSSGALEDDHADAYYDQLAAVAAHAIRNPLNAILTSLELLGPDAEETRRLRALEIVRRSAGRIDDMVAALADLVSAQCGRLELHKADLDLVPLLRQAAESVNLRLGREAVRLGALDGGAWVVGDRVRLERCLSCLCTALTATHSDAIELALGSEAAAISLTVSAPAAAAWVEGPLMRGELSRAARGAEVVGLLAVRPVILAHQGELVMAAADSGSSLRLRLPAAAAAP